MKAAGDAVMKVLWHWYDADAGALWCRYSMGLQAAGAGAPLYSQVGNSQLAKGLCAQVAKATSPASNASAAVSARNTRGPRVTGR